MYFTSRVELGQRMADVLSDLKGQQAVVLCLNKESIDTSIGLAASLGAWIYPLLAEPIVIPGEPRILGVINQEGVLCYNPGLSIYERQELEMDYRGIIQDASREAFHTLNQESSLYGTLHKEGLNGRTVIICGDIIRDLVDVGAATEFLKSVNTTEIVAAAGNIDVNVSAPLSMMSSRTCFMDVMSNMFSDDHYFEQSVGYNPEEQRQIMTNIATFWT